VFAALLVQESMVPVLYTLIVKHVQQYHLKEEEAAFNKIQVKQL
jgi:hypothetical protein